MICRCNDAGINESPGHPPKEEAREYAFHLSAPRPKKPAQEAKSEALTTRHRRKLELNRLVTVLGTTHELQNGENNPRRIHDPQYRELLELLIAEDGTDFIFEEATGLGPTTAEKLSLTWGLNHYLDVDPLRAERKKFGIPENTSEPIFLGSPVTTPPTAVCAERIFHEVHARREEFWLQQITKQDFKKALMICGMNHALSFAFRLQSASLTVRTVTYAGRTVNLSPPTIG
jgi:hypothetical protein